MSLRVIRLVLFVAELNGLEHWGADVANACLEAFTKDKVCMFSGPEFRPLQCCALRVNNVSCDLRTSGLH